MDLSIKMNTFLSRVKSALIAGAKLPAKDSATVINFLEHHSQREKIYAYAVLSLLNQSGLSKEELNKFSIIIETGVNNIMQNKEPFSEQDKEILVNLFQKAGLEKKQARQFISNFTALRGATFNDGVKTLREKQEIAEKKESQMQKVS